MSVRFWVGESPVLLLSEVRQIVRIFRSGRVCSAVFRSTIFCSRLEISAITSRSCPKSHRKLDVFGPPIFLGKGPQISGPNL